MTLICLFRYLKEKIKGEEEERRLLMARLAKYKELMEEHQMGRNNDGGKKYGGSAVAADESIDDLTATTMAGTNIQLPGGRIMSAREVEELIAPESIHSMSVSKTNQMYLWNLLVACYEGESLAFVTIFFKFFIQQFCLLYQKQACRRRISIWCVQKRQTVF